MSKLRSSHYRNVPTDLLGSAEHTLRTTSLEGTCQKDIFKAIISAQP